VAKYAQGLRGRVLKKKFVLSIEFWIFTFFTFVFFSKFYMMSSPLHLNVKFLICFKKLYSSTMLEF
jgi:hypothetical protein